MLPSSLRKLARAFNVEDKGIFPYRFVNLLNLDYEGTVPDFKYFEGITENRYQLYKSDYVYRSWNLRRETEWYCGQDCLVLYQVLELFFKENFLNTRVNASRYVSLPSLAFANFRTRFMGEDCNITNITGEVYHFIKRSYFGGAVDVYKPYCEKIYTYDVNSLYPFVMANNPMPVGKPNYFQGDIRKFKADAFGFFFCNIIVPGNLEHPILQTHVNTNSGVRTIAATGSYSDWIFSEEMYNAMKLGYRFKVF